MSGRSRRRGRGIVHLVGAGPGDPRLLTLRGRDLLRSADLILHDRLVSPAVLLLARRNAEVVDVGKSPGGSRVPQETINTLLVDNARRGRRVVRLKGGDPFVFGRGHEELAACRAAGVECVVVPGVSSAFAAPAAAGIPLTARGSARSFAVVTAETAARGTGPGPDLAAVKDADTLVILMGRTSLDAVAGALVAAGRDPATPAAAIERATLPRQRFVAATLGSLAGRVARDSLEAPLVVVVGGVAASAAAFETGRAAPLEGRRVVLTGAPATERLLRRRLGAAGAVPVSCPLVRVAYAGRSQPIERPFRDLARHRWIVFSSIPGVRGFWKRLVADGGDARRLAPCHIAAVGSATAAELARRGLLADVVRTAGTAGELAEALATDAPADGGPTSVLVVRGDRAAGSLTRRLRAAGAVVDEAVVYAEVDAEPSPPELGALDEGADAIVFRGPAAVRRFAALPRDARGAVVVCLGAATARAARAAGVTADIVAVDRSVDGVVVALERRFAADPAPRRSRAARRAVDQPP